MTIAKSFANYLHTSGVAALGQDLFIGNAPSSNVVPDAIWWIKSDGGAPEARLVTGGMLKNYQIQVFYRNRDGQKVYDKMFALEQRLNEALPHQIKGFDMIELQAFTFPIDSDLDDEDRKIGLLQANLKIYREPVECFECP